MSYILDNFCLLFGRVLGHLIDPENIWHKIYEITTMGAVLVRPDGHVAWRSKAMVDSPIDTLRLLLQV